jgi:hypothetical protein
VRATLFFRRFRSLVVDSTVTEKNALINASAGSGGNFFRASRNCLPPIIPDPVVGRIDGMGFGRLSFHAITIAFFCHPSFHLTIILIITFRNLEHYTQRSLWHWNCCKNRSI